MKNTQNEINVSESSNYDNMMDLINLDDSFRKLKPTNQAPSYPFTLKVRVWKRSDADLFARTLKQHLSSQDKRILFKAGKFSSDPKTYFMFTEHRENLFIKKTSHIDRVESKLWTNTVEWVQNGWEPYFVFEVQFDNENDLMSFCRITKQTISLNTKSINFPEKKSKVYKFGWKSTWSDCNPQYPVYIVSKGRADSRLTSKTLENMKVPYHIVIEPQDYDEYACIIDPKKLLVLPFSNHGDGPGRARNWVWDHSTALGFKRHWVLDDNIDKFYRLHRNKRYPLLDGGMFRVCEEFVDRFKNVPVAGPQYRFFCHDNQRYPPFVLNTRVYSCLLIENSCKHRWRGRYNEDTDLCLNVLKDGDCVMQFNNLLQGKMGTQLLKGGNTDEFYDSEGTANKSLMLEKMHPDVVKTVWKFNRIHHEVDYSSFQKNNKPAYKETYRPESNKNETESFGFERIKIN